jgi:hypothetical protein
MSQTDSTHDSGPEESEGPLEPAEFDTWDMEAEVSCPYCGEGVTIGLDPGSGSVQTYVEDCQVCCQPWRVHVRYDYQGVAQVWVEIA